MQRKPPHNCKRMASLANFAVTPPKASAPTDEKASNRRGTLWDA